MNSLVLFLPLRTLGGWVSSCVNSSRLQGPAQRTHYSMPEPSSTVTRPRSRADRGEPGGAPPRPRLLLKFMESIVFPALPVLDARRRRLLPEFRSPT